MDRLREHWEEANARVTSRRDSLEDMLLEVRQYEEMQAELDRWLSQVEEDVESQRHLPAAKTSDTLERQASEHRVSISIYLGVVRGF